MTGPAITIEDLDQAMLDGTVYTLGGQDPKWRYRIVTVNECFTDHGPLPAGVAACVASVDLQHVNLPQHSLPDVHVADTGEFYV